MKGPTAPTGMCYTGPELHTADILFRVLHPLFGYVSRVVQYLSSSLTKQNEKCEQVSTLMMHLLAL